MLATDYWLLLAKNSEKHSRKYGKMSPAASEISLAGFLFAAKDGDLWAASH